MGSPTFGLANGAPQPAPGNTNPTGTNTGLSLSSSTFPSYSGLTPLSSNSNVFSGTSGGLASLSSGFSGMPNGNLYEQNLYNMLGKSYGQGTGQLLGNILEQGLFNPQTAAAFLNAMQPGINQGTQSILNQFGSEGARFGSSANLGLSNYLGQVNLDEQQTLASMYLQAQQEQLSLLENVLPTLHSERANQDSWVHDIIGGLEIGGGLALTLGTGGIGGLLGGASLIGAGGSQLGQGLAPGTGGGSPTPMGLNPLMMGAGGLNTGTFGAGAPSATTALSQYSLDEDWLSASGGNVLGGASMDPSQLLGLPLE